MQNNRARALTTTQLKTVNLLEREENIRKSIMNQSEMSIATIKEATEIGYKNTPDRIYETDQFGFLIESK